MTDFIPMVAPAIGQIAGALTRAVAWPAALAGEPLLIHDLRAEQVRQAYVAAETAMRTRASARSGKASYEIVNHKALIPVEGALLDMGDADLVGEGGTSYGRLVTLFRLAAADPAVDEAVLLIDSPGGTVKGIEEATAALRALAAAKPVRAHVAGMACSAAYWLAAQADEIALTDHSFVGSIGVYTQHTDISGLQAKIGIKKTLIAAGEHKVDGNPNEPLSDQARSFLSAHVENTRRAFAREVAAGRGDRLSMDAALATQAAIYTGRSDSPSMQSAVEAGLADLVALRSDYLNAPNLPARDRRAQPKGSQMSEQPHNPGATQAGLTQEQLAAAQATSRSEGVEAGAAAATARIGAILGCEAAKTRASLASHLAFKTAMVADDAIAVLSASAEEKVSSRLDGLVPDPQVTANPPVVDTALSGLSSAVDAQIARNRR